jgi:hypothetical protein
MYPTNAGGVCGIVLRSVHDQQRGGEFVERFAAGKWHFFLHRNHCDDWNRGLWHLLSVPSSVRPSHALISALVFLFCFVSPPPDAAAIEAKPHLGVRERLLATVTVLRDWRMLLLLPLFVMSGLWSVSVCVTP